MECDKSCVHLGWPNVYQACSCHQQRMCVRDKYGTLEVLDVAAGTLSLCYWLYGLEDACVFTACGKNKPGSCCNVLAIPHHLCVLRAPHGTRTRTRTHGLKVDSGNACIHYIYRRSRDDIIQQSIPVEEVLIRCRLLHIHHAVGNPKTDQHNSCKPHNEQDICIRVVAPRS